MTDSTAACAMGFTRCAVCKIDLKGRFVYIDEGTEKLLGFGKEELFGKSLLHFLDEPSQELIHRLLSERNHYETFYDTTLITVLNRRGQPVAAQAIASLNFIAGNPVNFQLILHAGDPNQAASPQLSERRAYEDFLDSALDLSGRADLSACARLLREFAGARQVSLYVIRGDKLEPRSGTSDNSSDYAFETIPETTALHQRVARTGREYSCTDEDQVRAAIETDGEAPGEYVARFRLADGAEYLLRLIFSDDESATVTSRAVARARLAMRLIPRLLQGPPPRPEPEDPTVNVKFTIGFLDSLDVGAALTQADGRVIGYNPTLTRMMASDNPGDHLRDLVARLPGIRGEDVMDSLASFMASRANESTGSAFGTGVRLPADLTARLVVTPLSDIADDQSVCLVLLPDRAGCRPGSEDEIDGRLWRSVSGSLRSALKRVVDFSDTLGHRFHQNLGREGDTCLSKLNLATRHLGGLCDDLDTLVAALRVRMPAEEADLNLILAAALAEVRGAHPDVELACDYGDLPKVRADRGKLGKALVNILSNCARFSKARRVTVSVSYDAVGGCCRLKLADDGIGIPAVHLPNVFEFSYRVPRDNPHSVPGSGTGLSITRTLMRSMGGDIEIESENGKGTTVTVTLPIGLD